MPRVCATRLVVVPCQQLGARGLRLGRALAARRRTRGERQLAREPAAREARRARVGPGEEQEPAPAVDERGEHRVHRSAEIRSRNGVQDDHRLAAQVGGREAGCPRALERTPAAALLAHARVQVQRGVAQERAPEEREIPVERAGEHEHAELARRHRHGHAVRVVVGREIAFERRHARRPQREPGARGHGPELCRDLCARAGREHGCVGQLATSLLELDADRRAALLVAHDAHAHGGGLAHACVARGLHTGDP